MSIVGSIAFGIVVALCSSVAAQQPKKIPRIGFLNALFPSTNPARLEAFRQGLRDLGYVEGKNIIIEYRSAEGKTDRLPELAVELARLKVDLIFSTGPQSTRAAKKATSTIPIVMGFDNDPVGNGFVASLARPGGNITGLSTLAPEISAKQLELLNDIVARLSRVAVFGTSTQPGNAQALKESELAAGRLGVQLQFLDILGPNDIEIAYGAARKGRADAGLVLKQPRSVFSAAPDYRPGGKDSVAVDLLHRRLCGGWRAYDLRRQRYRLVSARRDLCRQDS